MSAAVASLCQRPGCGHPRSHHFHRPRKPPSRVTPKEDAIGVDCSPLKCLSFVDLSCRCGKFMATAPQKMESR